MGSGGSLRSEGHKIRFHTRSEWGGAVDHEWNANRAPPPLSDAPLLETLREGTNNGRPLGCPCARGSWIPLPGADRQLCRSSPAPPRHPRYTRETRSLCAHRFIIVRVEFHSPATLFAFDFLLSRIYCFPDRCDLNQSCLLSSHSKSSLQVLWNTFLPDFVQLVS